MTGQHYNRKMKTKLKTEVLIIGAGASGLMCAIHAGRRGRSVLVLDHSDKMAAKIRVSGGGRCNFSNRLMGREHYISRNPRFVTSALSRFTPSDFLAMVEEHGISYHEREDGRLFCNESSADIIAMLKSECDRAEVGFQMDCGIVRISKTDGFRIESDKGIFESEALAIATGGLSYPNLGATNFGYTVAKQFGLKVTGLHPALTPLRFRPEDAAVFRDLAGISIDCTVHHGTAQFRGNLLFTHNGASGPAVLQISSCWDRQGSLTVDLLPGVDISAVLLAQRRSKALLSTILDRYLPEKFLKLWCGLYGFTGPINRYPERKLDSISRGLHEWHLPACGTEGFNKAEVTMGGVDTDELSSRTMECKKVPGLYFLGEVIDVTGHLGGYNLHWAWASGHAAGRFI